MERTDRNRVILVDENDNITGYADKYLVHAGGLLHRAVSVFIVNTAGEWILQRRAADKYHSEGLWTNTCCTHPLPGESVSEAARRRLMEEMGLECEITEIFSFIYYGKVTNELVEHEYDHVFTGVTDNEPEINPEEVMEWKRITFDRLKEDVEKNPSAYSIWFRKIFESVNQHLISRKNV